MPESSANERVPTGCPFRPELLPFTFLVLAIILLIDPWSFSNPAAAARKVPPWVVDPRPVRSPSFRPEIKVGAYIYECSDCHRLIDSPRETERMLTQHDEINFEHGLNTRCFNCHKTKSRDVFAGEGDQQIPYNEPDLLCAKCHGPVYRDWLHRAHGRTNGYWDIRQGPMERRSCVECHDPHYPSFPAMTPAPAPHTLRMGKQTYEDEHGDGVVNPLQIYRRHTISDQGKAVKQPANEHKTVQGEG